MGDTTALRQRSRFLQVYPARRALPYPVPMPVFSSHLRGCFLRKFARAIQDRGDIKSPFTSFSVHRMMCTFVVSGTLPTKNNREKPNHASGENWRVTTDVFAGAAYEKEKVTACP